MSKHVNFIGADIGASNGRLLMARFDGSRFDLEVLHRFPNHFITAAGRAQWDILRIWSELLTGLTLYTQKYGSRLEGIGIDTWGVDFGLLDRDGQLIGNPVAYRDARTDGIPDVVGRIIPASELFSATGSHFIQFNSIFQLYAMRQQNDPQLEIADTFLMTPDLLNYWFTGVKRVEYTIASTSMMIHAQERRWITEMLARLNLPASILPPIIQPGEVLGTILPAVAELTGLDALTRVLTVGSHDTASAVAAVPGMDADSIFISSGTWSLTGVELPAPILTPEAHRLHFTNEGGVGNTIRFLQNFTGLWLLQQCHAQWQREGMNYSWEQLMAEAAQAHPFTCVVNPDAHDFFAPSSMPAAIVEYAQRTGQTAPQSVGALARCCLESLALNTRWGVEVIEAVTGRGAGTDNGQYRTIRIVGGGCQNHLLNQWIADACNRQIVAGPAEATALGNVMMQAIATGHLSSIAQGREIVAASTPQTMHDPDTPDRWEQPYAFFKGLKAEG